MYSDPRVFQETSIVASRTSDCGVRSRGLEPHEESFFFFILEARCVFFLTSRCYLTLL